MSERFKFKVYSDHGRVITSDVTRLDEDEIQVWQRLLKKSNELGYLQLALNGNNVYFNPDKIVAVEMVRCWSWSRVMRLFG